MPAAGAETVRYGGNTSCVEVCATEDSVVVLDAGTGIRALGNTVSPEVRRVDVLLGHLHMDHILGLGFFAPLFRPDLEVHLWGPGRPCTPLYARLTRYLSPPLFPVRLRDLPCRLTLHDVPLGTFESRGSRSRPAWCAIPDRPSGTGSTTSVDARVPQRPRACARRP